MNKFKYIYLCAFSILLLQSGTSLAQTAQCTQKLDQAQASFDIGNLPGIPVLLEGCINNKSFSPEESIRAHKLLTLVYLYQDDDQNADLWMSRLLSVDPEHRLDPAVDPSEIVYLKEKFRYEPIFRVSASFGVNFGIYSLITEHGVGQYPYNESTYTPAIGINGHLQVEKELFRGIDIGAGLGYVTKSYDFVEEVVFAESTIAAGESQTWFELPVFAKYTYYGDGFRKLNPYAFAGMNVGYLSGAVLAGNRTNGSENSATINIGNIDLLELEKRNKLNYFALAGVGAKIRTKTNFFFAEVRYIHGLNNIVNGDNRYPMEITTGNNTQNIYGTLGYVDDDFSVNGVMVSVGYQLSIYNPKKIIE